MFLVAVQRQVMKLIHLLLFKKKTDLRANYIESDMEEDINMKNQFKIKNLPNPY